MGGFRDGGRGLREILGRGAVLVLIAVLLVAVAGCASGATPASSSQQASPTEVTAPPTPISSVKTPLVIAISGMVTPKNGLTYYLGLCDYIGHTVGRPVRLIHKADYTQTNQMLKDRKVDVAFVCSGPYVSGHDSFGLKLLVAPVVNGETTYQSYVIVARSSTATSIASLKGKIFAFTDPQSNSGKTVPTYMLARAGTTPERFFKETFYTYGHDNSIKAVAQGQAAGAAVDSLIYQYDRTTMPQFTSKTKIIQASEKFAIPPVVVRPGLDPTLVAKLRAAFLGADKDPQGAAILKKMHIQRFTVISDGAYDPIRAMNAWITEHEAQ